MSRHSKILMKKIDEKIPDHENDDISLKAKTLPLSQNDLFYHDIDEDPQININYFSSYKHFLNQNELNPFQRHNNQLQNNYVVIQEEESHALISNFDEIFEEESLRSEENFVFENMELQSERQNDRINLQRESLSRNIFRVVNDADPNHPDFEDSNFSPFKKYYWQSVEKGYYKSKLDDRRTIKLPTKDQE